MRSDSWLAARLMERSGAARRELCLTEIGGRESGAVGGGEGFAERFAAACIAASEAPEREAQGRAEAAGGAGH